MTALNKALRELLQEDQEPFLLESSIADRRRQLRRPFHKTQIQISTPPPIPPPSPPSCFPCALPGKNNGSVTLRIAPEAAALLLEAAVRVQRPAAGGDAPSSRLLWSVMRNLSRRNRNRSRTRLIDGRGVPVKYGRQSGGDASSSGSEEIQSRISPPRILASGSGTPYYASPPGSPPGRTAEGRGNGRRKGEEGEKEQRSPVSVLEGAFGDAHEKDKAGIEGRGRREGTEQPCFCAGRGNGRRKGEEGDKEQSSPVSVLEGVFSDDGDAHEKDKAGIEGSSAIVNRAERRQLLVKLRKFEKLGDLSDAIVEEREAGGAAGLGGEGWRSGEGVAGKMGERNTIDAMVGMDLGREEEGWRRKQLELWEVAMEIEGAIFGVLVGELPKEMAHMVFNLDCVLDYETFLD